MKRLAATCMSVTLLAAPSDAIGKDDPSVLRELATCRTIVSSASRLACFDAASARLDAAVAAKEITVLDREGIKETKRALFGFSLPESGIFARKDEPEFTEIDSTVQAVARVAYDKFELTLPDGARWRTTMAMRGVPRPGDKIRIRKAALGSYFLSIDGERGVKGLRIR